MGAFWLSHFLPPPWGVDTEGKYPLPSPLPGGEGAISGAQNSSPREGEVSTQPAATEGVSIFEVEEFHAKPAKSIKVALPTQGSNPLRSLRHCVKRNVARSSEEGFRCIQIPSPQPSPKGRGSNLRLEQIPLPRGGGGEERAGGGACILNGTNVLPIPSPSPLP